jgi:tRNA-uridine 2-sulfurtransferase
VGVAVGAHAGVHRFTLGQRKGLGVAVGKPAFVTRIDPASATVHLGDADALASTRADVIDVALREGVDLPRRVSVRVRHGQVETPARIEESGASGRLAVTFDQPVRAVSPGQLAVFYDDGRVLGGGRIARARAHAPSFPSASSLLRSDS